MCSIDIPIMRDTTRATRPFSYQQVTQSTRTRPLKTNRASHRAERFTDWDAGTSKPNGFVGQLMSAYAPARIIGRFGQAGFGELDARHVTHGDEPRTPGNGRRDFVRPVLAGVLDLGVQGRDAAFFAGTPSQGQSVLIGASQVIPAVHDPIRAGNLVAQSEVNADLGLPKRFATVGNLAVQVNIPAATAILREATRFDLACDFAREPEMEKATAVFHGVANQTNAAHLEGYPTKRAFMATPGQARFAALATPGSVLLANSVNGLGMKVECL